MRYRVFLRFLMGVVLLITANFFLLRCLPGTPLDGIENLNVKVERRWIQDLSLDQPLFIQYANYVKNIIRGDLGPSVSYAGLSVNQVIFRHASNSLGLSLFSLFLTFVLSAFLIVGFMDRENKFIRYLSYAVSIVVLSAPSVILAPVVILVFGVQLGLFPLAFLSGPQSYFLPAMIIALRPAVHLAKSLAVFMQNEISKDYVRTAKAKGLATRDILFKHILKNSVVPLLNSLGPLCVGIVSGSAFVEILFAIPGLGTLFIDSLKDRDYFLSSGLVLVFGTLLLALSAFFEFSAKLLDPRLAEAA